MNKEPDHSWLISHFLLLIAFTLVLVWGLKIGLDNKRMDENHLEVLYFRVSGCPWCKVFEPTWNNFALKSRLDNVSLTVIEYEIDKELINKFNIKGFPSLLIVRNNRKQQVVGPVFPLIYKSQTLKESMPGSEADKIRAWNVCELAYFVKEKTVPKGMVCENKPH